MRYTLEKSEIYAEIKREMERYRDYAINKSEEEIKARLAEKNKKR